MREGMHTGYFITHAYLHTYVHRRLSYCYALLLCTVCVCAAFLLFGMVQCFAVAVCTLVCAGQLNQLTLDSSTLETQTHC